jgi:RNase adaptor protein for sRNA GlmZ degradation
MASHGHDDMTPPAVLVVTGASGAGKTALLRELAADAQPGVGYYHFDSIGIPSLDQMMASHGSPQAWQVAAIHQWISALAANRHADRVAVLEGQMRPTVVQQALEEHGIRVSRIVLIDCATEVRDRRLREARRQPELSTAQMTAWGAYLRGQADALGIPVLNTTGRAIADAVEELRRHLRVLEDLARR